MTTEAYRGVPMMGKEEVAGRLSVRLTLRLHRPIVGQDFTHKRS